MKGGGGCVGVSVWCVIRVCMCEVSGERCEYEEEGVQWVGGGSGGLGEEVVGWSGVSVGVFAWEGRKDSI